MKFPFLLATSLSLTLAATASGSVLNLVDVFTPSADPVASGYHVDSYPFPVTLLNPTKPIHRLSIPGELTSTSTSTASTPWSAALCSFVITTS